MAQAVEYILKVETKGAEKGLSLVKKSTAGTAISLDKAGASGKKLGTNWKQLAKRGAAVGLAMGAVALAAKKVAESIIAATKAMYNFTKNAVDAVNRLNDLSTASNLSVSTIAGLELAFAASGQSIEKADSFAKRFPMTLKEIMKDGSDVNQVVDKLTDGFINNSDELKTSDEIFKKVIDSLQGIENQTLKTQVATTIFGRQAGDMLIALGNSAPLENFIDFTKEYGVDAERSAKAAATFQQHVAALSIVFAFLKDQLVFALDGMGFFQKGLKITVGTIVFVAKMISLFQEEIAMLGRAMLGLTKFIMNIFIGAFLDIAYVAGKALPAAAKAFNKFNNTVRKLQGLQPMFLNTNKRIKEAWKESAKAQKKVAAFGAELKNAGKNSETAKKKLKELWDLIRKLQDGDDTADAGGAGAVAINRTAEAIARAKQKLKELQEDWKNNITNTNAAYKSAYRLERTFKKLQIPTTEVIRFKDELKKAMDTAEKAKFDKEAAKIKDAFVGFVAAFEAGGVSLENALGNIDGFFDKFKEFQIDTGALEKFKSILIGLKKEADKLAFIKAKFEFVAELATMGGDIAGGNIENILGSSLKMLGGPIGKAIADSVTTVLGSLAAIGEKTPEQMEADGKARIAAITKGLEMLPAVLLEVLPPLFLDLVVKLVGAIVRLPTQIGISIFKFFQRIVDSIRSFFGGDIKENINEGLNKIASFLTSPFERIQGKMGGGYFHVPQAANGLRFTGEKRGLAMLHEGEVVVPRSGRVPQGIANSLGGGGGINLTINSAVVDGNIIETLVRQIEDQFTQFGSSTSTVLG